MGLADENQMLLNGQYAITLCVEPTGVCWLSYENILLFDVDLALFKQRKRYNTLFL
jgi:hypothetical protein